MDFTNEANNLERFWKNNTGREGIIVPKCYREYTCEAVLTDGFYHADPHSGNVFFVWRLYRNMKKLALTIDEC